MSIVKIGLSGLRYLFGKGAKTAKTVLPKVTKNLNVPSHKHEFLKQTSIYDPNSFDYIHRIF